LHVPSPFVGATCQINNSACEANPAVGTHAFHPPFNQVPIYREPGRININTIFTQEEYTGLMNYFPSLCDTASSPTDWESFVANRRGYPMTPPGYSVLDMDPLYPTRFARPFRAAVCSDLVPTLAGGASLTPDREVNATVLREGSAGASLFGYTPLIGGSNIDDPNRNPYFRYQGIQRLGNLVTTRSNVYAVWITVGYFYCNADGTGLGSEVGSDTGEVERHRGFYIIDRTIPVGFRRGEDLNAENAVLVRRFIE